MAINSPDSSADYIRLLESTGDPWNPIGSQQCDIHVFRNYTSPNRVLKSHHVNGLSRITSVLNCIISKSHRAYKMRWKGIFENMATESIKSCIWDFNSAVSNECNKMVIEFRVAQFWSGDTCNYQIELALRTRSFWHNSYNFCLFALHALSDLLPLSYKCCDKNSIYLHAHFKHLQQKGTFSEVKNMSCVYNTERHGVKLNEYKMLISQCVSCYSRVSRGAGRPFSWNSR